MDTTIKVTIKNVYGKETIYPACEKSEAFVAVLGQKTLTKEDIDHIKKIGFTIEVIQKPVKL